MLRQPSLIAVVGPTASGKTSLGEALAREFGGEIISADSRQVYRGLDLGSGKEELSVKQHLIDICDPGESFTAAEWKRRAAELIVDFEKRGIQPIVVGGTGLYVSSLLEDFSFGPPADPEWRREISTWSPDNLVAYLLQHNAAALKGLDVRNRRYLERAVEKTRSGWRQTPANPAPYRCLLLQPDWPREELYRRIDQRLHQRMKEGMLEEVNGLLNRGVEEEWLRGLGLEYRYLTDYIEGRHNNLDEAIERLAFAIHHFARRQLGWWRRSNIRPVLLPRGDVDEAIRLSRAFLQG